MSIYARSERELRLAQILRAACVAEIGRLDDATASALLGFKPPALHRLLEETDWDLQVAFRAAASLGVRVVDELLAAGERSTVAMRQVS